MHSHYINSHGKYIYEKYGGVGLSRTTGFDITKDNISQYITPQTIFINNAFAFHDLDAQSNILDQAINASKIICIGTNSQWEGVYKDAKGALKLLQVAQKALGKIK